MAKTTILSLLSLGMLACSAPQTETACRVEQLLDKMTLTEKIGQMAQLTIEPFVIADGAGGFTLDTALLREAVVEYGVGSLLNVPLSESQPAEVWGPFIGELQRIATDETRLGIPLIYGVDQVHGGTYSLGSTLFPQQIALAATWNPAHARRMGEITAYEMRACNIPWNFAPILDLGADPRFPRQYEGFGEDPYLGSVLGRELVKGQEGDDNDVDHPERVATCLKHFLGYSVPASGKDRTPANIPWNALMEYHLPAFREALDAGAHSVMVNSGIIDNEPVHASRRILTGLLRDELGFAGVVVTDYEDLEKLHARDRLAATSKDAICLGINAGIDMAMIPIDFRGFCRDLRELVEEGAVPMERIDEAVRRILRLKFELGLFERPNTLPADYPRYGCEKHRQASYAAAAEAITLLKNDGGLLPLDPAAGRRILVCGPNAQSRRALCGGWTVTWQGHGIERHPELCKTLAEALGERFGRRNVEVIPGVSYDAHESRYDTERRDRFDEAAEAGTPGRCRRAVPRRELLLREAGRPERSGTRSPANRTSRAHRRNRKTRRAGALGGASATDLEILGQNPRHRAELPPRTAGCRRCGRRAHGKGQSEREIALHLPGVPQLAGCLLPQVRRRTAQHRRYLQV